MLRFCGCVVDGSSGCVKLMVLAPNEGLVLVTLYATAMSPTLLCLQQPFLHSLTPQITELLVYVLWLFSFVAFTILLVTFYTPMAPDDPGEPESPPPFLPTWTTPGADAGATTRTGGLGPAAALRRIVLLPLKFLKVMAVVSPTGAPPSASSASGQPAWVTTAALALILTCCLCLVPFVWMELASIRVYK